VIRPQHLRLVVRVLLIVVIWEALLVMALGLVDVLR
jgi:hypothetical protein